MNEIVKKAYINIIEISYKYSAYPASGFFISQFKNLLHDRRTSMWNNEQYLIDYLLYEQMDKRHI